MSNKKKREFIESSGASDIDLFLDVDELQIESSGASDIKLKGRATDFELINSGASSLKAGDFEVKEAYLDCSGASDSDVNITEKIKIDPSGACTIKYKGSPIVETSVSGTAIIKRK